MVRPIPPRQDTTTVRQDTADAGNRISSQNQSALLGIRLLPSVRDHKLAYRSAG